MEKACFENFLRSIKYCAEQTKSSYISAISLFVRLIGEDNFTMDGVRGFIAELEKKKYSESSINLYLAAVRKFFNVNGIVWDNSVKSKHVNLYNTNTPSLSIDNVRDIIHITKQRGNLADMSYLALSTIYGLRCGELASITRKDIRGNVLHVKPLKKNVERDHLIPDEISFICEYPFEEQSLSAMNLLFTKICLYAGYKKKHCEGWHSPRRSLIEGLYESGIIPVYINFFIRWSPQNIGQRYVIQAKSNNPITADRLIFEKHPFLPFWR
ncbi:MAG: site-specific integrase [bacterium]|nr:site-specific integrase [bacterium]